MCPPYIRWFSADIARAGAYSRVLSSFSMCIIVFIHTKCFASLSLTLRMVNVTFIMHAWYFTCQFGLWDLTRRRRFAIIYSTLYAKLYIFLLSRATHIYIYIHHTHSEHPSNISPTAQSSCTYGASKKRCLCAYHCCCYCCRRAACMDFRFWAQGKVSNINMIKTLMSENLFKYLRTEIISYK